MDPILLIYVLTQFCVFNDFTFPISSLIFSCNFTLCNSFFSCFRKLFNLFSSSFTLRLRIIFSFLMTDGNFHVSDNNSQITEDNIIVEFSPQYNLLHPFLCNQVHYPLNIALISAVNSFPSPISKPFICAI